LELNGKEVKVGADLSFITKAGLKEGANALAFKAADAYGNIGEKRLDVAYEKTSASPHATDALAYARKAAKRISIDGKLDDEDWVIDNKANKAISGAPNNILNFGVLWDRNYLYVGAEVYDTSLIFDDERVYQNDCFEVFLNPSNDKKGQYGEKDKQLFVGYPKNRTALYINTGAEYKTGWSDFPGGYTVEMAIPWGSTGLVPEDGLKIGFDISCDDKDAEGPRESVMAWSGTSDNWQDTRNFGTIVLTSETEVEYKDKPEDSDAPDGESGGGGVPDGEISVNVPGGEIAYTDAVPVMAEGTLMLPLRATAEAIGGRVEWIAENNEARVTVFGTERFYLGAGRQGAALIGERLYVPVGFIESAFGLKGTLDGDRLVLN
jgi:hypothetical protein